MQTTQETKALVENRDYGIILNKSDYESIVNGVNNPCCVCQKPTRATHWVKCTVFNYHGECHEFGGCILVIGSNCLKKEIEKRKVEA